jgi:hypothetical protein
MLDHLHVDLLNWDICDMLSGFWKDSWPDLSVYNVKYVTYGIINSNFVLVIWLELILPYF